jgi:hypothetical protein
MNVPAAVPSLHHGSRPCTPSSAANHSLPLPTFRSSGYGAICGGNALATPVRCP